MPKNATLEQRVKWHEQHAQHCTCREMPPAIKQILRERGKTVGTKTATKGPVPVKGAASVKKFAGVIKDAGGGGMYVDVPFDVEKVYGTRGQVKIKATFDGEPYRGIISNMGTGCHILIVLKAIRAKIGKEPGDKVNVTLQRDTEVRTVDVPADFQKALNRNKAAKEFFAAASYSTRKEYVRWIEEAKREVTRNSRIEKAVEKLALREKFS